MVSYANALLPETNGGSEESLSSVFGLAGLAVAANDYENVRKDGTEKHESFELDISKTSRMQRIKNLIRKDRNPEKVLALLADTFKEARKEATEDALKEALEIAEYAHQELNDAGYSFAAQIVSLNYLPPQTPSYDLEYVA